MMPYPVDHVCDHGDVVAEVGVLQGGSRHPARVLEQRGQRAEAQVADLQAQDRVVK